MFIILIVATVSGVYAYAQTHQIAYIKYVQFFVYQLHLNKAVFKKKDQASMELSKVLAMI